MTQNVVLKKLPIPKRRILRAMKTGDFAVFACPTKHSRQLVRGLVRDLDMAFNQCESWLVPGGVGEPIKVLIVHCLKENTTPPKKRGRRTKADNALYQVWLTQGHDTHMSFDEFKSVNSA